MVNKKISKSQCVICEQEKPSKKLLCDYCQRNKFNIDTLRSILAQEKSISKFQTTYKGNYLEVEQNQNTKSFWDKKFNTPEIFDEQDEMTREKINYMISQLPQLESRILDLGIGQGYLEQRLKKINIKHNIYGIDISERSIDLAKKNYKGTFTRGDLLNLRNFYKQSFFDVIIAIEVIEHIPPTKIFSLYKSLNAFLKPRGLLIISTPLNEHLKTGDPNPSAHLRQYTIPILKTEFLLSDFRILKIKTFTAFKKSYTLKKILSIFLPNKWEANNVVIVAEKK